MSRRTFLVTGATGDTGGATVEQMLARGHHVRALAHRQDDPAKRPPGLRAQSGFGDFFNPDDVPAALSSGSRGSVPKSCSVIFSTWMTSERRFEASQALTFATPSAPGSFRLLPSSPRPPRKPALNAW